MRRTMILAASAGVLLVAVVGASAYTAAKLRVAVPFEFYAGNELLPAGEYVFAMRPFTTSGASASSVAVFNHDGRRAALVSTRPGADRGENDNHLHFHRYGDTYFLSRVECVGSQADLDMTKAEQEYRAQTREYHGTRLTTAKETSPGRVDGGSELRNRPRLIVLQGGTLR